MTEDASGLGPTLRSVRDLLGKSLKAVAGPADISPAYLVKLERGEVAAPSPHVLRRLAASLDVDYLELMRLAGYVEPTDDGPRATALAQAFGAQELTDDEVRAVSVFLEAYRSGTGRDVAQDRAERSW